MRIILVEDEVQMAELISHGLASKGYAVDMVHDGKKALDRIMLNHSDYNLFVLDLMLPSITGIELCKKIREHGINTPILILTSRNEIDMKVQLLESGADDYLIKPFSFDELYARVGALLRRPVPMTPVVLEFADIELHSGTRTVYKNGKKLALTLKEYVLLDHFMRNLDKVVNREELLSHLWDFNYNSFSNVVDVHIKNLRKKLDSTGDKGLLETIRGIGYRLKK